VTRSGLTANVRIVEKDDALYLLAQGEIHQIKGDSAELIRALLLFLVSPRTREEIFSYIEALAGGLENPSVIDDALALLSASGAIAEPRAPKHFTGRIVLAVSGAIAAANSPELASRLKQAGFEVRVALTRDARRFVSPFALEAITQQPVAKTIFHREVPHIVLAEWAQLVLVCPASATTISRIASGDCSDLVSAVAIASRAPKLLIPSMNEAMLASPQVQRNLSILKTDGYWITPSGAAKEVATGSHVGGGMPSHDAIVDLAAFILK
jgi:phosphopantothenoylcysteine decarboxylase/phosphopantothenate--cysteine ligase